MDRESRFIKSASRVAVMLLFGVFWYYAGYSVGFGAGANEMRFINYATIHAQIDERAGAGQDPMPVRPGGGDAIALTAAPNHDDEPGR